MGLDNVFVLNSKKYPDNRIRLAYFRKYFELNEWMLSHCSRLDPEYPYEVIVTQKDLEDLLDEIEPIAQELQKYSESQISYFNDNGYSKKLIEKFYGKKFSPVSSTYAAGHKLLKLYSNVLCMIDILDWNRAEDIYITFYSDF